MIVLLLLILSISAAIAAFESAILLLNPEQMEKLCEGKMKNSTSLLKLLRRDRVLHVTLLILRMLTIFVVITLAMLLVNHYFSDSEYSVWRPISAVAGALFLIAIFGELMPRFIASGKNLNTALRLTPLISFLNLILTPLSLPLAKASSSITRVLSKDKSISSLDKLQQAIENTQNEVTTTDQKMISDIARFSNTYVDEIMKPRIDVIALNIDATYTQVQETVIRSGFSRIPVFQESLDNIIGILYVKDMIPYLDKDDLFHWRKLLRDPFFIPEHKKINDLLEDFQDRKVHLAIIVDEYGSTMGVVTLEDILEEIVGEISDEADMASHSYHKINRNTYIFEGKMHLGDFERILSLQSNFFDEIKDDADTVAGLMLEIKSDFFKDNESIEYHGITFTANRVENHRIIEVLVTINQNE